MTLYRGREQARIAGARLVALADRDLALHAPSCEQSDVPAAPTEWLADLGTNITTDRDELIRYAQALRPCYDRLGRVIGQLAGLIILARLGSRFEADWPVVARVLEQIRQTDAELHAVVAPTVAAHHHAYLMRACVKVLSVGVGIEKPKPAPLRLFEQLDGWTRELKQAGAMLSGAAVERLGLMPVDFSQACCNCGATSGSPGLALA